MLELLSELPESSESGETVRHAQLKQFFTECFVNEIAPTLLTLPESMSVASAIVLLSMFMHDHKANELHMMMAS